MLTLSLLRHAKSNWDDAGLKDFDRPLAKRGETAAPRMGAYMAAHGIVPELILCSSAVRARQTLALVLPSFADAPTVVCEDGLYLASASALLARIRKIDAKVKHALVVGHDPGMHGLALELSNSGNAKELEALASKFPTAGLAVITFNVRRWPQVKSAAGRLICFMTPKRLP